MEHGQDTSFKTPNPLSLVIRHSYLYYPGRGVASMWQGGAIGACKVKIRLFRFSFLTDKVGVWGLTLRSFFGRK